MRAGRKILRKTTGILPMMEGCLFCVRVMRRMFCSFVKGFSVKDFPPIRLDPCYNSLH
ncbi:hypothetical protein SELSPUOL_00336 [Selenomonas sputigena ATCC 35185]|uniref:Uncharacterized protein n=1 Tax=Selenomonas sputigena (strain ATCC 35185 / DSM 20758 / CCUG 44933 / VPI D19B-28) TaxID=546271 RepID=C9LSB2_SELS3|nr:hypothetical protein SELSPUOL_00336 [Selenomonas sputigena ATCC 35185]